MKNQMDPMLRGSDRGSLFEAVTRELPTPATTPKATLVDAVWMLSPRSDFAGEQFWARDAYWTSDRSKAWTFMSKAEADAWLKRFSYLAFNMRVVEVQS